MTGGFNSMGMAGWKPVVTLIAMTLFAGVNIVTKNASADTAEADRVAKIKSAYLLNFLRFAEWPAESFEGGDGSVRICLVGDDTLGSALDDTVAGQAVGGRSIQVQRLSLGTDLSTQRCHLVYIGDSEAPRLASILSSLGNDTLTVGESGSFAADGTMLALNLERDRIIFYANRDAIRAANVSLSSKILQLARIVHDGDRVGGD